jgi:hypothetical protein
LADVRSCCLRRCSPEPVAIWRRPPGEISDHDQLGINFSLPRLAAIHGSVTDSDGTPPSNVYIYVIDSTGGAVAQGNALRTEPMLPTRWPWDVLHYADRGGYFDSCSTASTAAVVSDDNAGQRDTNYDRSRRPRRRKLTSSWHRLPVFHGHVQDATTGLPCPMRLSR